MHYLLGFVIALAIGMTGIGGGSFTVPALIVLLGLAPDAAVGTAFVFACILRLIAAPFYIAGKNLHLRYLWLLLLGAIPGLAIGTFFLRDLTDSANGPLAILLLGVILSVSSSISFLPRAQNPDFARKNPRWMPWLAFPIGAEAGFSSAGAGALGTVLLLNFSEMTPSQVVGTDLLFGLVIATLGSAFHWRFGAISEPVLGQLLAGGVPGVLLGCLLARWVPARKLKLVVASIAILAGLQLIWNGAHSLFASHAERAAKVLTHRAKEVR